MKIFSSIALSLALLSGCTVLGARYDSNEYLAFANIAFVAQSAKANCGAEPPELQKFAEQIKDYSSFAVVFTKHEPYNQETYAMAQEIESLSVEFKRASKDKMTEGYCKIKLDTIQHVAEVAMEASASKRRQ